jgi:hypothetical protein
MDIEENSSDIEKKGEPNPVPIEKPSSKGRKNAIPAKQDVKTKKSKGKGNKEIKPEEKPSNHDTQSKKGIEPQILVALIGTLGTFAIALLSFPPLIARLQPNPTPTFTSTATTFFITDTPTATQTSTSTPTLFPSPTVTDTPTSSVTPSVTMEPSQTIDVFVVLVANRNTGRPPLNIRLDARDSYLLEPDGTRLSCRGGPCFYTWIVYSGGQQIGRSEDNSSGTFEYIFGQKGTYTVTVLVCRGRERNDCAGSGAQIIVSK